MRKIFAICLLLVSVTLVSAQYSLTVEIGKLENNKGVVIVDLLDKNEETVMDEKSEITNNKCTIIFKDLQAGTYAIRCFHDENSNGELDTNFIGIPKEGFGFSNDAFGKFGPKKFSEWLFDVQGDTKLLITTNYL